MTGAHVGVVCAFVVARGPVAVGGAADAGTRSSPRRRWPPGGWNSPLFALASTPGNETLTREKLSVSPPTCDLGDFRNAVIAQFHKIELEIAVSQESFSVEVRAVHLDLVKLHDDGATQFNKIAG
jgi:hypothetical protein